MGSPREDDPDLPLVAALQGGDERALDGLMARHAEPLFRFVYRYLGNEADAREVAQEAFVRAYFAIGSYRPRARFATWLHHIALNLCRDRARSRAGREARRTASLSAPAGEGEADREFPAPTPDPAAELARAERLDRLRAEIDRLPARLKAPFVLAALEGLSHQEAGRRLGLTAKAVEGKVRRAREILLRRLGGIAFRRPTP